MMTNAMHVVGWALVHFLWQGAAVALVAASVLALMGRRSAAARYVVAAGALAVMLAAPLATGYLLATTAPESTAAVNAVNDAARVPPAGPGDAGAASVATQRQATLQTVRASIDARLPIAVALWLAGVALLLVRLAGGWWRVRTIHRRSWPAPSSPWQAAAHRLAARVGLARLPRVVDSTLVDTPTVVGWVRPLILLPVAALAQLTPAQVEAVLAHELAHIRRHDYIVNVAQTLAEATLFYHPAVWWLSSRIRTEREQCCDDVAVRMCGDAVVFVDALTSLERWRSRQRSLAMAASGGHLLARVRRLVGAPEPCDRSMAAAGLAAIAGVLVVVSVWSARVHGMPAQADRTLQAQKDWTIRETEHFAIYYRDGERQDVDRVAAASERAYRKVSGDLRHDLGFAPAIVLFPTRDRIDPDDVPRAVEHILLPMDVPGDQLDGLLVHEVTHVFSFDILPDRLRAAVPPWIHEGLSEHERGSWTTAQLAALRGVATSNQLPIILNAPDDGTPNDLRNEIGHAAFDYIDATYGKNSVRQFLFAIRQSANGAGASPFEAALRMSAADFERAVGRYVVETLAR
jgi:beta-lactamase regulating signal transducer with metallopeptidase domain